MKISGSQLAATSLRLRMISILLVDADKELSLIVKKVLRSLGFSTVHHAKDGKAALDILRKTPVDLVITDWDMQPMSGIEFIDYIRNHANSPNRTIPIIMLTGRAKREHVERARDKGITEYVVKPFTARTLCDRIVLVISKPRDFVITPYYTGPDRRRRDRAIGPQQERREKSGHMHPNPLDIEEKDIVIIDADYSLQHKIGLDITIEELLSEDNIREAQKIITQSRDAFLGWIVRDMDALEQSYNALALPQHVSDKVHHMRSAAMQVKSRAGTFGYDLASHVADSLHDVCLDVHNVDERRLAVMRKHIDALYVIFRRNILGEGGGLGAELLESLLLLSERYKKHE